MAHVCEETRLGPTHRFSLISRGSERLFVTFALGDIRVDDDNTSFRQWIVSDFKDGIVGTGAFERVTLRGFGGESLHFRFDIDGAVFAPLR